MPRLWDKVVEDPILRNLHAKGMSMSEISRIMGRHHSTISKRIIELCLRKKKQPTIEPNAKTHIKIKFPPLWDKWASDVKEKINPLTVASFILGKRFDHENYKLDGKPTNLDAIMVEVNKVLKKEGKPLIICNEKWTKNLDKS